MNKEELLLGLIDRMLSQDSSGQPKKSNLLSDVIGKKVLVRSSNEGINFGTVVNADETGIELKDARRLYYHKPKDSSLSWYEGVAESGLHKDSKVSGTVRTKILIEKYSVTMCTAIAIKSITEFEANES